VSPPRTIQALIGARLSRLDEGERAVIHRASVVGKIFYWGAVAELSNAEVRPNVGSHLQALLRKELIEPEASTFAGEDAFRFSHVLVRDSAYDSIPKRIRAELHERFAAWLEQTAAARLPEYEEIVGHHLEQAYRHRRDLGALDERARDLARRAAEHAATAGRRAIARGDMRAADKLLTRALDLLDGDDPARGALLTDLGGVLFESGTWDRAGTVLAEAVERARAAGDRGAEGIAIVRTKMLELFTLRFERNTDAIPDLERAVAVFDEIGHEPGLAEAWIAIASIQFWSGAAGMAVSSFEQAITHARRAGDQARLLEALRLRSLAETFGPTPAPDALRRLDELSVSPEGSAPVLRSASARMRAALLAMRGEHEAARAAVDEAKMSARELGMDVQYAAGALRQAMYAASAAGDLEAAETAGREAIGMLRRIGDMGHLSSVAADLAEILGAMGVDDEAMALSEEGERATLAGDVDAEVLWRLARVRLFLRQGRIDDARALAADALARAQATDYLELTGLALMRWADVLSAAGRPGEAADALREAADVFGRKGHLVGVERARARLAQIGAAQADLEPSQEPLR
jgi:tetratricopeptide (TPR) repeat protein